MRNPDSRPRPRAAKSPVQRNSLARSSRDSATVSCASCLVRHLSCRAPLTRDGQRFVPAQMVGQGLRLVALVSAGWVPAGQVRSAVTAPRARIFPNERSKVFTVTWPPPPASGPGRLVGLVGRASLACSSCSNLKSPCKAGLARSIQGRWCAAANWIERFRLGGFSVGRLRYDQPCRPARLQMRATQSRLCRARARPRPSRGPSPQVGGHCPFSVYGTHGRPLFSRGLGWVFRTWRGPALTPRA